MLKKTSHALRRADKILASAICMTLGLSAAAVAYAPYAEHKAPVVQKAVAVKAAPQANSVKIARTDAPTLRATPASYQPETNALTPAQEELLAQVFLRQGNCLADAMYYEARGEGRTGELAIAEVIYNRMRSRYYPGTICGVVYEGSSLHTGCQFSFTCSGDMDRPKSAAVWRETQRLALQVVMGLVPLGNMTGGALSYHSVDVQPGWADTMERTTQIGHHIFYKPYRVSITRGA
ncbi:MAG TPA: cell wall hydrolase [Rhizomicrobium sp.]|nr:cell wall hydrolase [Rhizomicrobium sp.]